MVWISEEAERKKPSLSASRIATSATSGRSSPSRSRLMPTSTSNSPSRSDAQDLDALDRVDVGVQVLHPDPGLGEVGRQVLRHLLREGRDEDAVALPPRSASIRARRSSICPLVGHDLDGRVDEARRPDHLLDDRVGDLLPRRARASPRRRRPGGRARGTPRSAAGGCRGREGSRKPCSTRTSFARLVTRVLPVELRHRHVGLVDDDEEVVGEVVEQRVGPLARRARPSRCRQ